MPNDSPKSEKSYFNDTTRFLANTLHEIRTPIQTIIGAAELIKETRLDKEQKEYVRQIRFSAEGLLELANNILDLAKMSQSDFKIENIPFDIVFVTEHLVNSESIKAFNKGVELVLDISSSVPALVSGDSMRVRQIMLNLISNAVKFTHEGFVHVELDYSKNEGIRFTVTDTGIGINEEKQKKLFTEYVQADISTYRLFGGTGLGLSISKNLVKLMGGSLGLKSEPGKGSSFFFTLPLKAAIDKPPKLHICKNSALKRILIIDDNPLASESLKKKLALYGFSSVDICHESTKVIDMLSQEEKNGRPYDMAFIDMQLEGGIDGWHLAFDIQNSEKLKLRNPLYLLVPEGQLHEDAKMKFLNLFKGYLYKPVKRSPLIELLKNEFSELEKLHSPDYVEELRPLAADADQKKTENETKKIASGLKILVAEDHPMNRRLLETFLKRFGAQVYLAENGEEALETVINNPGISMVFMDIFMPKKDGIETTKELRAMHYNEIIIACTANNDKSDFDEYRKIGINDILVKPFKSDALRAMLEKWKEVLQTLSIEQINLIRGVSVQGEGEL